MPARVDIPAIDRLVEAALADGKMPGAVVVVGRSDGVVFQRAYGARARVPRRVAMSEDTIFDLASLTKPVVTASLVQHLVDGGKLRLDDPVGRHLPAFATRGKRGITLRQLLLHVSGLPNVNPLADYRDGPDLALARILDSRLSQAPGRRYVYSDLGYIVLGELVETVAGEALDALAQRVLFEPLAMHDTAFRPAAALRDRIAPTEETEKRPTRLIHGEVHDPRAYRLGGVAGNAGLFSTAHDLARFARMLLGGGQLEGRRVLSRMAVQELTRPHRRGGVLRTPGWDVDSDYAKPRGRMLSPRAFGHGGYTGTSLWIDPLRDVFVLFLSNRVHPDGKGNVIALEGAIADAAMRAIDPRPRACAEPPARTRPGIDRLVERGFEGLAGRRVGLVTHRAAVAADATPTLDKLVHGGVELAALFTPEHGLDADAEGVIAHGHDDERKLPIYSLFGKTRRPTARMLADVDVLVVDLVDVGARFYTYMSTLHQIMLAGAEHGVPVMVLDRPNPIGGVEVEGPMLDRGLSSFVNYHPLPVRHGMTAGELAELINDERAIGARLEIVEAPGWRREAFPSDTGLPWQPPSPNLPSPEAALLYPAIGLLEGTNVSVGRGTDLPFRVLGAPFVDGAGLAAALDNASLPGVAFEPFTFTPRESRYRGEPCAGIRARITDARAFRPVRTGLSIARALARRHAHAWESEELVRMVGSRRVVAALLRGAPVARLERLWEPEVAAFRERRAPFLRYPRCAPPP